MKCSRITVGGTEAIVCGSQRIQTCACGKAATRLCDWKKGPMTTCDAPICDDCTTHPAMGQPRLVEKNKDLCKRHAEIWAKHPANKQQEMSL